VFATFWGWNSSRTTTTAALFLSFSAISTAGEGPNSPRQALPSHRVVLRVSERMLGSLLDNKDVDRQVDVRDVILGTSISGTARVTGKPDVTLADSPDQATFQIVLNGTAHSRTTGYNGPAIIHSRSVTTFTATKQIVFDPGKGFYGLPSKVTARTQVFVEGIGSTRGGLFGRIVRRRAAKEEAARHAEATEIARQKAERRIAEAFDRNSEKRLVKLNWVADFRSRAAAALRATGSGEPKYACCTTPHYLQIASSFSESDSPIELPTGAVADAQGAPIQIWFHESLVSEQFAAGFDLLKARAKASDFLNAFSVATQLIAGSTDVRSQVRSLVGEEQISMQKVGEWRVVQLDMTLEGSRPIAQVNSQRPNSQRPNLSPPRTAPLVAERSTIAPAVASPGPRIWTSGQFTADAEFLALEGNIVRLRRVSGITASIPIEKLSAVDQTWIKAHLAGK